MKKILALLAILLALGAVAYFYFEKELPSHSKTSIYHAIPAQFPIALESADWPSLFEKIDTFKYGKILNNQDWLIGTKVNIAYVDALMKLVPATNNTSANKTSLLAFGNAGNSQLGIHLVREVGDELTNKSLKSILEKEGLAFNEYSFNDDQIITLLGFNGLDKANLCVKNGLLLFSIQASFVEESLLALESKQLEWEGLLSAFSEKDDARLYIKPKELNYLASYFLKSSSFELMDAMKGISDITAVQLYFFENELNFSGYVKPGTENLLDTLAGKLSAENYLVNSLPANTAHYKMIAMTAADQIATNDPNLKSIFNLIDEAMVLFTLESYSEQLENRKGALLQVSSQDIIALLNGLDTSMHVAKEIGELPIYEAKAINELLNQVLLSPNYFKSQVYFTQIQNEWVCSESIAVVEQFIAAKEDAKMLKTNQAYTDFKAPMSSKCLLEVYTDLTLMQTYLSTVSTENTWQTTLNKFDVQYSTIGEQIYCNGKIGFNQNETKVSKALWTARLDTNSIMKPQIVRNHNSGAMEVLAQDAKQQLYLLNTSGEVQWKIQVDGKIMGDVQQIDYYKNKKLQYLFNTPNKIYIVDRNGDFVDGFPIDLPAKASNGILLVNYDNAGIYRYMVACENGNVYGYEQNGSPLPGWSPKKDVGIVKNTIQYTVKDNKDYLYFSNDEGVFYALNRKAEDRFKPVLTGNKHNAFIFDENAFVGGDKGMIYEIDALGNMKTKTILDSSFVYCEVKASIIQNSKAYAFAAGSHFKFQQSQWKNFSSFTTEGNIIEIESLINKNQLWFVLYTKDKVYLIDELGTLHPDFPIATKTGLRLANLIQGKDRILLYNDNQGNVVAKEIVW